MRPILRHPYRYLAAHWAVTGLLAATLLMPHQRSMEITDIASVAPPSTVTLVTGQSVFLSGQAGGEGEFTYDPAYAKQGTSQSASGSGDGSYGPGSVRYGAVNFATGTDGDTYAYPADLDRSMVGYFGPDYVVGSSGEPVTLKPGDRAAWEPDRPVLLGSHGSEVTIVTPPLFDPLLFDVSYLLANGFDDAHTDRIPVIVRFASQEQARTAVAKGLVDGGIHLTGAFEYQPEAYGYVSKAGPFVPVSLNSDGVQEVYLDAVEHEAPDTVTAAPIAPTLNDALPLIGADAARKAGLTGKGIKIAVVDTGIDAKHPDFANRIVAAKDFSSDGDQIDHFGHGTHVAGIAAGTGAVSDGKFGGVAPGAQLIDAKALAKNGSGSMSGIIKAMEWAADQGAKIENMSLGGGASDGRDPLSQEVNAITAKKGVLFAIAAGNSGPKGKVSTPAAADLALSVGAVDKARALAYFSSRGPRVKDNAVKPDVVAPGVRITAPRANYGDNDPYATYSGTSMATPMVAGAAALVMQLHPDWSAMQVKNALMNSASAIGDNDSGYISVYDQGTGLINLSNILGQKVLIQPGSLSFGMISNDTEVRKDLTFANLTDQPMTIDLAGGFRQHQGSGNAGFELTQPRLTIPASDSVTITLRLKVRDAKGIFSGELVASRDGQPLARVSAGFTVK